jgi:hypothetical protein
MHALPVLICWTIRLTPVRFIIVSIDLLPPDLRENYECHEWKHACAILIADFPAEWEDIIAVLREFRLKRSHVIRPGGSKSKVAEAIDKAFYSKGWQERYFATKIVVDQDEHVSPTHSVDCYKNGVAVEIEWNNKDPFYARSEQLSPSL